MEALRMNWYSLISIHNASRAMLSKCLTTLKEYLKPYLNKGLTAIFKCSFLVLYRFSKSLKIWKSELDLTNVIGTFYHWYHLITDANDAIMHQPLNESTKLLKILFKNLWMGRSTTLEIPRHSETPCLMISLFDTVASKM